MSIPGQDSEELDCCGHQNTRIATSPISRGVRPASVGVLSANSTDFVSLEELRGNDLFNKTQNCLGRIATKLLTQKPQEEYPSSPQQQQHDEKAPAWRDFATPAIFNNQKVAGVVEAEGQTDVRKLYLGVTGTNESGSSGTDTDGHSDVRITYIGGSDRPGTTADRDALQTKKKSFHRPTKSAGARPNPLRVAAPSSAAPNTAAAGAPTLQRMSSFRGSRSCQYLADQYRITYSDAGLKETTLQAGHGLSHGHGRSQAAGPTAGRGRPGRPGQRRRYLQGQ